MKTDSVVLEVRTRPLQGLAGTGTRVSSLCVFGWLTGISVTTHRSSAASLKFSMAPRNLLRCGRRGAAISGGRPPLTWMETRSAGMTGHVEI
jgi:hypothetical protein